MMRISQITRHTKYTGRRPYSSLMGATTRLPAANPSRYVVSPSVVMVVLDPNSPIRPGMLDV